MTNNTLIDTSAFVALLSKTDTNHEKAIAQYEHLIDHETKLFVASSSIFELSATEYFRGDINIYYQFYSSLLDYIHIIWITKSLYDQAIQSKMQMEADNLTIEDWLTFTVAQRYKANIFSFHRQFIDLGVITIP